MSIDGKISTLEKNLSLEFTYEIKILPQKIFFEKNDRNNRFTKILFLRKFCV